ncbi:SDR family oxidoreductase [Bacillus sp. FJAT-47783]|uniref:SDR family oxidoreductase n=1 Tax=Bacillus sp. FJAT-47783 TaxID=2922712 RepID=UPI001FAD95EB|nr:SDR family oxidoreductase [Bacillus sp. FJAT-47783]
MNIFLTGSTGFLGGKLIRNLLLNHEHEVYLLVRNVEKAEKLRDTFPIADQNRIHIFKGDITFLNGGLQDDEIHRLKGKIDTIYHLAALVKFDLHLRDEIFAANYDGTKNILDLALALNVKKFFYVSTAYTVGKEHIGIEELYPIDNRVHNPYEESKVKSEHLVYSYQKHFDVSIFRPAIIVGDSKTGEADSSFTLYGFMRALDLFKRKLARGKELKKAYRLVAAKDGTSNIVPVDYVANILSLAPEKAKRNTIYHITNPNPPTNFQLLQLLKDALQFHQLSVVEDIGYYKLDKMEERLNSMVEVFNVYLTRNLTFNDDNTKQLIQGTNIPHLFMTDEMIKRIIFAGVPNRRELIAFSG